MLGDYRVNRAYPWPEFTEAGAVLALGSDAPTAPHPPLPNMFIATTRRSAIDPSLAPNLPKYALPLADALAHATRDAAYSCRWEDVTGQLVRGKAADFVVLKQDPFTEGGRFSPDHRDCDDRRCWIRAIRRGRGQEHRSTEHRVR